GGPSYFQAVLRSRVIGPLLIDLGALGMAVPGGAGANASAGVVLDVPLGHRWSVFGGGGAGCGGYFAGGSDGTGAGGRTYVYGRGGVAVRVGFDRRDQVGVEGAVWSGAESFTRPFVWPVPGVFWLHTL